MDQPDHTISKPGVDKPKRRIHWHVFLTHLPISFFTGAFTFQILHLFIAPDCFELATNVAVIGGTAMLFPAIATGWLEWKKQYHGAKSLIFKRKILTAFGMAALSVPLTVWRIVALGFFQDAHQSPEHWIYLAGNTLLIVGAVLEGYNGGRLNHR